MKKKYGAGFLILCMIVGILFSHNTVFAASGATSVSVSASSVNIGDTVTVTAKATGASGEKAWATMTVSYDSSVLQFVSCSATYGGGGSTVTASTDSFTVTLKAVSAGTSKISLAASDGVVFDTNEELASMSGSSTSVTVNNAASTTAGSTTTGNTTTGNATGSTSSGNTTGSTSSGSSTGSSSSGSTTGSTSSGSSTSSGTLSADNSLKSLSISPGTLSPSFSGSTTKYTATVGNDVTSIAVSAVPANDKASVTSVSGNSSLAVGSNTITVVVKAENGVTATYAINVTRQASGTTSSTTTSADENTDDTEKDTESAAETESDISVDGVPYRISEQFTEDEIPEDFVETTIVYHEAEYRGVSFEKGSLAMLYLVPATETEDSDQTGSFYIYDETRDTLYSFIKLTHGNHYVIALLAPVDYTVPENYVQMSVEIDGQGMLTAYQETAEDDTELASDFYFFYGVNSDGTESWYCYDAYENTYQRCQSELSEEESVSNEDVEYLQEQYTELSEKYKEAQKTARTVIAILIFVLAVCVIVIINLLLHRFHKWDDENIEEETDENELDEETEDGLLEKVTFPEEWRESGEEETNGFLEEQEYTKGQERAKEQEYTKGQERAEEQEDDSFIEELEELEELEEVETPETEDDLREETKNVSGVESNTDEDFEVIDLNDL